MKYTYKELIQFLINHIQWFLIILGAISLITCHTLTTMVKDLHLIGKMACDCFKDLGGFCISTGLLAIGYEKWKSALEKERYFMMCEDDEIKSKLDKIDFCDYKPEKKIFPIMENNEFYNSIYRLPNLLEKQRKGQTVFIYGTSLHFFEKKVYKDALFQSIERGVNFELSLVNPDSIENNDSFSDDIKMQAKSSMLTIQNLIDKITPLNDCGYIEIRYTNIISPNSFSSLSLGKYRNIRTFDFNFGEKKYCQVFDFTRKEKNNSDNTENNMTIADNLYTYYHSLYEKNIIAYRYPVTEPIKIYVCVPVKNNEIQKIICDHEGFLPCITIQNSKSGAGMEDGKNETNELNDFPKTIKNEFKKLSGVDIFLKESIRKTQEDKNSFLFIGKILSGNNSDKDKNVLDKINNTMILSMPDNFEYKNRSIFNSFDFKDFKSKINNI